MGCDAERKKIYKKIKSTYCTESTCHKTLVKLKIEWLGHSELLPFYTGHDNGRAVCVCLPSNNQPFNLHTVCPFSVYSLRSPNIIFLPCFCSIFHNFMKYEGYIENKNARFAFVIWTINEGYYHIYLGLDNTTGSSRHLYSNYSGFRHWVRRILCGFNGPWEQLWMTGKGNI
jgi:hypothetical protein